MDDLIIEKNKAVLQSVGGYAALNSLNQDLIDQKKASDSLFHEEEFVQWLTNVDSYILLQDWIPRSEETSARWKTLVNPFFSARTISSFINDQEIDPHLLLDLANLRDAVEQAEFDPNKSVTTTQARVPSLIAFGTGNGDFLSKAIEKLNPISLTIVVTEWEDFASSFQGIDWLEIWNSRCKNDHYRISILKVSDDQSLKLHLGQINYALLDHALIYCSPVADNELKRIYESMRDSLLSRSVYYLGFAMDEYNMIWNSWEALRKNPRVFQKPHVAPSDNLSCIVCGSGPSLDRDLDSIKLLSSTHLIIACASNYGTLRKHGIDVDVLCLLERGEFMVEQYQDIAEKYGVGHTHLLASVTTPAAIQDLFQDSMVYFRPALTPLAIFAEHPGQILSHEGPQTVNTGVALALALGASSVILSGVDLGSASLSKVRSEHAIGESPREFDQQYPGNHQSCVYTNELLLDGKIAIESTLSSFNLLGSTLLNASDGIKIEGFSPIILSEYVVDCLNMNASSTLEALTASKQSFKLWWKRQPRYEPERFIARWKAANPRQQVHQTVANLKRSILSNQPWLPAVTENISKNLSISTVVNSQQFCRRIIRGHIIKLILAITRQLRVMSDNDSAQSRFLDLAKLILIKRLDEFESEIYQLIDALENTTTTFQ